VSKLISSAVEENQRTFKFQLDEKDREWLVKASQVDYHALAKLAAEKPKLVHLRVSTHFHIFKSSFSPQHLPLRIASLAYSFSRIVDDTFAANRRNKKPRAGACLV